MNIALCTDENFTIPALVCITSVLENNKGEDCHVYVLTDGISQKAMSKFSQLSEVYGQPISVMTLDKKRFKGLSVSDRFPVSMYYRFLLPEMLPEEHSVLYLDCDTIVRAPLRELFDTRLEAKALAAVVGESCDDIVWKNSLLLSNDYFNSGVLFINLDYWRKYDITNKLIRWVSENPGKCDLPDQNALNKVLDGKVVYLDYRYNYQEWWTRESLVHYMHFSKWNDIREAGKDPIIIHFCEAVKPWFEECRNPYKNIFLHYASLHPFIGFRVQKRYGIEYGLTEFVDRVGLKIRWWAERWQNSVLGKIKIS